jgi:hypothetical protein
MAQQQTVTAEDRDRAMGIDPDWVQCAGCPDTQYVTPERPDHLTDCAECSQHCQCWRRGGHP